MVVIENKSLRIEINPRGAELNSIYGKEKNIEYLWNADPAFWAKKSPVLFPIVGTIKKDSYYFQGKEFKLSRHGFARDMDFAVVSHDAHAVLFSLTSNENTLARFPFDFRFDISYKVIDQSLFVTYTIVNTGQSDMFFSVGAHPAFKVPLADKLSYHDYYLEFDKPETQSRWRISKAGLIEEQSIPFLKNTPVIPLQRELFYEDAIVFKSLRSQKISLKSALSVEGLTVDFTGFPYLGLWAAKNADFICIEPWCGIADSVSSNQQLSEKEGINPLGARNTFERTWSVTVF